MQKSPSVCAGRPQSAQVVGPGLCTQGGGAGSVRRENKDAGLAFALCYNALLCALPSTRAPIRTQLKRQVLPLPPLSSAPRPHSRPAWYLAPWPARSDSRKPRQPPTCCLAPGKHLALQGKHSAVGQVTSSPRAARARRGHRWESPPPENWLRTAPFE